MARRTRVLVICVSTIENSEIAAARFRFSYRCLNGRSHCTNFVCGTKMQIASHRSGGVTKEPAMRKTWFALSALAAVAITASVAGRTEASPLGNPTALSGAVDELAVIDNVHCRSGWRHHEPNRWRRADGCRRYGGVIVVPGSTRYVVRDGVRVRVRAGDRDHRSRTTIRSGEGTTVRSRTDVNVRGTTGTGTRQEGTGTRQEGGARQGGTGGQQKGGGAQKGSGGQEKSN
jgi:hypothetical protein